MQKVDRQEITQKWNLCLEELKEVLDPAAHSSISDSRPIGIEGDQIYISVPGQFSVEFLNRTHFLKPIQQVIQKNIRDDLKPKFVKKQLKGNTSPKRESPNKPKCKPKQKNPLRLNPEYTFKTYITGPSNRLAAAAASKVAESPGERLNPLYIYGPSGVGKTHLLHAIGHKLLELHPAKRVICITTEQFVNEFIHTIQTDSISKFRHKYRESVDVLLMDDIQSLAGKERTQEEFFHTFNFLHSAQKQIVFTSDQPYNHLHTLNKRLQTRFGWGMAADIEHPDYETRVAIIKNKAAMRSISLPDEVVEYLTEKFQNGIRELEGVLSRIKLYASIYSQEDSITLDIVKEAIKGLIPDLNTEK
ncbi:MAG: chromosomal replication initiator protein DnaA, partial [Candidatus Dadabacteria bacterium]